MCVCFVCVSVCVHECECVYVSMSVCVCFVYVSVCVHECEYI